MSNTSEVKNVPKIDLPSNCSTCKEPVQQSKYFTGKPENYKCFQCRPVKDTQREVQKEIPAKKPFEKKPFEKKPFEKKVNNLKEQRFQFSNEAFIGTQSQINGSLKVVNALNELPTDLEIEKVLNYIMLQYVASHPAKK